MGKKKRGHADIEDLLNRAWCYYCERDFEDLKLLINHQKAKHFKCERCGRRLNTAGGLSVHMNQVHKESLDQVENALPNRQGLDIEIFGMEGIPAEVIDNHRQRLIQNFYQAQEERRIATGNPLPGQKTQNDARKKIKIETAEELKRRLSQWRAERKRKLAAGESMDGVVINQFPGSEPIPARPSSNVSGGPSGLPQRPGEVMPQGDDIDNLIRMAEAGIRPPPSAATETDAAGKAGKKEKEKDKKGKMIYDDAEFSPEERMAALPRYAFTAA